MAKMKPTGTKMVKSRGKAGSSKPRKGLSKGELAKQQGADLPDREAMSLVNANLAAPINLAAALNVLSDNSVAYANAEQYAPIEQDI
jgi:hypothetical protein